MISYASFMNFLLLSRCHLCHSVIFVTVSFVSRCHLCHGAICVTMSFVSLTDTTRSKDASASTKKHVLSVSIIDFQSVNVLEIFHNQTNYQSAETIQFDISLQIREGISNE